MHATRMVATAALCAVLFACGGGGSSSTTPTSSEPDPPPPPGGATPAPQDTIDFTILTERTLTADGEGVGLDAYDLVRDFAGPNAIEAPDLYPINHPEVRHIYEDTDTDVGNHFVFIIHRDIDIDRDRPENDDRQRNEIKTYASSEEAVKGYQGETFIYRWKFKINDGMTVSTRFTHLFQLKAVGGDDSQPILTISGARRNGEDGIEVRHSPLRETTILQRADWRQSTGIWLQAYCRVTYTDSGSLRLILTRMHDGSVIFDIQEHNLDLWRGENETHFVRPKWGIYRSILDRDTLRADEEQVRFADFTITEVMP